MDEVGRAVEWINYPLVFRCVFVRGDVARLLGEDGMGGVDFAQGLDDGGFSGAVDFGDVIILLLEADLDLAEIETCAVYDAASAASGLDGRVEHRVHE